MQSRNTMLVVGRAKFKVGREKADKVQLDVARGECMSRNKQRPHRATSYGRWLTMVHAHALSRNSDATGSDNRHPPHLSSNTVTAERASCVSWIATTAIPDSHVETVIDVHTMRGERWSCQMRLARGWPGRAPRDALIGCMRKRN